MISVIVPTIRGREHWLERCERAYCETTEDFEFIIVRDLPSCNQAWNVGMKEAQGEIIHLSADDLEPHPGWHQAAMLALAAGFLPCPRVLNGDGTLQSCGDTAEEVDDGTECEVARVPFFHRDLIPHLTPIPNTHYMGDYWISNRAKRAGWETRVVRQMVFTHHLAPEGRKNTLARDLRIYRQKVRR